MPDGNRNIDAVMDEFIEEHSQSYEFRDPQHERLQEDRYFWVFQALQKELCRLTWPSHNGKAASSRPHTLRVLQCLRLMTRDPELQFAFFEGGSSDRDADQSRERHEQDREWERDQQEHGRERGNAIPPPAPATSSRAAPHPPSAPPASSRAGYSASPWRTSWRNSDGQLRRGRSVGTSDEQLQADDAAERATLVVPDTDRERGIRLPRLEFQGRCGLVRASCDPLVDSTDATPTTLALLRLLTDLVAEYLAELESGNIHDMHAPDVCAGAGTDTRLGIAVAGLCVAEIVGMLNRYASTEARQSRLARSGVLRPLTCLLRGMSDPLVLRCALETLVHFTINKNTAVLVELAQLSLQDNVCCSGPTGLLRECVALLACRDETYKGLAAQLLEQLLEAPELRAQIRRLRAIPTVLACLLAELTVVPSCESDHLPPLHLAQPSRFRKSVHMLRCCQKLARDHVELGDTMAVQELREHDALGIILQLVRHCQRCLLVSSPHMREVDLLLASLDTLAQMCMDDECATALRIQHPDGFVAVGTLLLDERWRSQVHHGTVDSFCKSPQLPPFFAVQCAAARLLRFLFAVERNRKAFKHIFPFEVLEPFVDVGSYIWPLEAYEPIVRAVNSLTERESALVRGNFHRSFERGMTQRRERPRKAGTMETKTRPGLSEISSGAHQNDSGTSVRTVCGYDLIECVGAGAFGRVHLARRLDTPGDFALKEIPLTGLSDAVAWPAPSQLTVQSPLGQLHSRRPSRCCTPRGLKERLEGGLGDQTADGVLAQEQVAKDISQEVRLLCQLDHPNIVQYYSSFTTSMGLASTLWIVMEFCSGISLQGFTSSAREKGLSKLPEDQTWQIFVQLCIALRYLHVDKGIAHRDLTANNVLVQSHTLAVKVADFGLARQKAGAGTSAVSMMTSMVGTILYSCPEIVQQKPYTHKTDIWALGCLLYKMATLRDPFHATNPLSVARRIVECDYTKLDQGQHSEMLVHTCQRCLTVSSETRPDIQEVCQIVTPALVRHLEAAQRNMSSQRQRESGPPRWKRSQTLSALSACVPSWDDVSPAVAAKLPCGGNISAGHSPNSPSQMECQGPEEQRLVRSASSEPSKQDRSLNPSQAPQLEDPSFGKVHVAKRVLGHLVDPIEKALLIAHRLAWVARLPLSKDEKVQDVKRIAIEKYQQWLFGNPGNAAVLKREVSRLMQRSQDLVECYRYSSVTQSCNHVEEAVSCSLTYERLHEYLCQVCIEHGYDAHHVASEGNSSKDERG